MTIVGLVLGRTCPSPPPPKRKKVGINPLYGLDRENYRRHISVLAAGYQSAGPLSQCSCRINLWRWGQSSWYVWLVIFSLPIQVLFPSVRCQSRVSHTNCDAGSEQLQNVRGELKIAPARASRETGSPGNGGPWYDLTRLNSKVGMNCCLNSGGTLHKIRTPMYVQGNSCTCKNFTYFGQIFESYKQRSNIMSCPPTQTITITTTNFSTCTKRVVSSRPKRQLRAPLKTCRVQRVICSRAQMCYQADELIKPSA